MRCPTGPDRLPARPSSPTSRLGEALYFDSSEHRLFGWLHRPAVPGVNLGMVVCQPFGYEAICAHRSVRVFAEAAAAAGVPTLRFDYAGMGDSEDTCPQADQIHVWSQDVLAAVAALRERTAVERVCLLGLRLGALLAILSAARSPAVCALALIAPIISGRRYVREMRTSNLAGRLAEAERSAAAGALVTGGASTAGELEVAGFWLSEASVLTLARIDLAALPVPPVAHVLVIDRKDLPTAHAWSEAAGAAGARTQYLALPGFVEMMTTSAQVATVPQAMLASMRQWLQSLVSEQQPVSAQAPAEGGSPAPLLLLPGNERPAPAAFTERPVFFGSEVVLFGIVSEPRQTEQSRTVILLNMGADHHVGAARLHVLFARHWAARGYRVMRLDLGGLGDSETRPGRADDEVFPPAALGDIRAAIDYMCARHGAADITLVGLCAGAYHALRAAAAGLPVKQILMVNPANYFWSEGATLQQLQLAEVVGNPGVYRERVRSVQAWLRLLRGEVNIWRIIQIYLRLPWLTALSALRDVARSLRIRLPNDLGWELEEIAARGVQVVFVFARGEPGIELLRLEGGSAVKRLGERCRVHILECGDHSFSRSADRAVLEDILNQELFTPDGLGVQTPPPELKQAS